MLYNGSVCAAGYSTNEAISLVVSVCVVCGLVVSVAYLELELSANVHTFVKTTFTVHLGAWAGSCR